MRHSLLHITLDLNTLTDTETHLLVDLLFPVQQRIFGGGDPTQFKQLVLQCRADYSQLQVRFNRLGQPVGYCAVHFFHIEHAGRPTSIMRVQAGLLPEYRRGNSMTPFILHAMLNYRLRHPLRQVYFFAMLIHPSSYLLCDKYARHLWPRPARPLSPESWHFLQRCLAHFGHKVQQEAGPQAVPVGLHTLEREADRAFWKGSDKPAVRFFLQHNPGYTDGQGLVTLAPLSLSNLLTVASRLLSDRLQRRWRTRRTKQAYI
ncbi:hypothetical protein [Paludibacterium purpuratum]|uniref:Acetyltransferase (GNAT) family protein n=1 Tax=Paludibacterium purpuratum TaxID=1144873 RepID=A0A4R7BEY9_9NEIS|nr:hypothetical protein [Paludibacterium purpuratum]TDR82832.1 hypothetical protein DFP86_101222 [Paludibacterium purpuratum]